MIIQRIWNSSGIKFLQNNQNSAYNLVIYYGNEKLDIHITKQQPNKPFPSKQWKMIKNIQNIIIYKMRLSSAIP